MPVRRRLYNLVACAVVALSACTDVPTKPVQQQPAVAVSLSSNSLAIKVGESRKLIATVANDASGTGSGVTWSSSNQAVVSVDSDGNIAGVSVGSADITATSRHDPTKSATANVSVSAIGLTLSVPTTALNFNGTVQITPTVSGGAANVTYRSSDPNVLTVDAAGLVRGVGLGSATITVLLAQDSTIRASTVLTVARAAIPNLGIGMVLERYTAEIAIRGDYAYTTTWSTRVFSGVSSRGDAVKIWNIAGAVPQLVDSIKVANAVTTSDVQVSPDGKYLVVSTEGSGAGSIVVYDITNPAAPVFVSRYQTAQTARGVHTVKLSVIGGKLYGFLQIDPTPAQLVIVDMSNPAAIQQVFAQVMGSPYIHDVFVRDGLLFAALWHDGMTIFDVGGGGRGGSPSNPVVIGNVKTVTGSIHNVWWFHDPRDGSKRYAFLGEEGPGGVGTSSSGDIHVIDVSVMTAPREVAIYRVNANTGTHNFYVDEPSGILYAAYYNGGVRALDIRGDLGTCTAAQRVTTTYTPPTGLCDLTLMGREVGVGLTDGYYVWGVAMKGNNVYASDMLKGIVALDVSSFKR